VLRVRPAADANNATAIDAVVVHVWYGRVHTNSMRVERFMGDGNYICPGYNVPFPYTIM